MLESWTLGTSDTCDVRIVDEYVSGRHARVTRDDAGRFFVEDLGSMNGTYLQHPGQSPKVRIRQPVPIQLGDTLWLGGRTAISWDGSLRRDPIRVAATVDKPREALY